jgi:hypothetical protein
MASERARIQASDGARMNDSGNVWYGPIGIAMTRSLGSSAMLRVGILPVPIVTRHNLATPQPWKPEWTMPRLHFYSVYQRYHDWATMSKTVRLGGKDAYDKNSLFSLENGHRFNVVATGKQNVSPCALQRPFGTSTRQQTIAVTGQGIKATADVD